MKHKNVSFKEFQTILVNDFKKINEDFIKNKIIWWPIAGTLLGALRHKGLIPWDDDIDMGIQYKHYIKNKEIIRTIVKKYGYDLVDNLDENNGWDVPRFIKTSEKYAVTYDNNIHDVTMFIDLMVMIPGKPKTKGVLYNIIPSLYFLYNDWYQPVPRNMYWKGGVKRMPWLFQKSAYIPRLFIWKPILYFFMKRKYKKALLKKDWSAVHSWYNHLHHGVYWEPAKMKKTEAFGTVLLVKHDYEDYFAKKYSTKWTELPPKELQKPLHIRMCEIYKKKK